MVQQHGRARQRHALAKLRHVVQNVAKSELDSLGLATCIGFARAAGGNFPPLWMRHQFTHRAVKHSTGRGERDVAHKLFPNQLVDVFEGLGLETSGLPHRFHAAQTLTHPALHFAQAYQLHGVVVRVTRTLHRGSETVGHAQQYIVRRHVLRNALARAQAILNRQYQR